MKEMVIIRKKLSKTLIYYIGIKELQKHKGMWSWILAGKPVKITIEKQ